MASGNGLINKNNQADPTKDPNFNNQAWLNNMPQYQGSGNFMNTPQVQQLQDSANATANGYLSHQQQGPYRGGMTSNFNFSDPNSGDTTAFGDADSDVRNAANTQYEIEHPTSGTNGAELSALNNMYRGRIGQKNSLAETIQGSAGNERKQEDILTGSAGAAEGRGLKNTRQNYNSRGLLYSGMRQGGEQQVKQGVASGLDASISGSKRDAAKSLTGAQNAYAAVDLANAQESLNLAHQAFDTASSNNIARLQAMQQLGSGVGAVAGYAYGNMGGGAATSPTSGWSPQQLQQPAMGSQYGNSNQGLL